MNLKRFSIIIIVLAVVASFSTVVLGQSFTAIRIGDFDGLGYGTGEGYQAANGGPVNVDGLGNLADGDFIPDLNENGTVATGSGDDFDNRSTEEKAGNYTEGTGFTTDGSSSGSQYTDIALSTSFDATFGTPNDFPAPPSTSLPNQPGFVFDFEVAGDAITEGQELFLNVVFGDYDVSPAQLIITRADGSTEARTLNVQPAGQDGLIQAAFGSLNFEDVFTANGSNWDGYLEVDFDAPSEPYTVFDYAEISTEPIVGGPLEIQCPPEITVDCSESTEPEHTGMATATGGVPPLTITYTDVEGEGIITRTWTVTDAESNTEECDQIINVTEAEGDIIGTISADCSVLGITVVVYNDADDMVGSAVTDEDGDFAIMDLPSGETYRVAVVLPIGYSSSEVEMSVDVGCGDVVRADFTLDCPDNAGEQRSMGFWKHQFEVATGGRGHGHISADDLCGYLDLIVEHFNNNPVNPVVVYEPPASEECADKLLAAKAIVNVKGNVGMTARARQQLLVLLLNVVSDKLAQTAVISEDGATVSQAITYCDELIDDPAGDHETAKTIADMINNGYMVPAGMIPLTTEDIAYKYSDGLPGNFILEQNHPNPFNPSTTISFALKKDGHVRLDVFNVLGQKIETLVDENLSAGDHSYEWDGSDVASGIYFYRMTVGKQSESRRMLFMK